VGILKNTKTPSLRGDVAAVRGTVVAKSEMQRNRNSLMIVGRRYGAKSESRRKSVCEGEQIGFTVLVHKSGPINITSSDLSVTNN